MSAPILTSGMTQQLSWEYLMPKRQERAAGYPRCSDENLHDSPTLESQAKAIRTHSQKEGYDLTEDHIYPEAMTAYMLPYTQRPKLMQLLAAARRGEFDVLVVTEVRAISRRQVEVFVIYDLLQKYGVRIETVQERFEDSAIGRFILATRAMVAELERENTYMRCQRGKTDRVEAGNLNGHAHPAYGYVFLDTEREVKARYDYNHKVIYVDAEGEEWTEVKVVRYIFDLARQGESIMGIVKTLNYLGIPTPRKPKKHEKGHWQTGTVHVILKNRDYTGEAYANKVKTVGGKIVKVPFEEQIPLPVGVIPPIISKEIFTAVQEQLTVNKQESLRNNKHTEELGVLRAGYVFCGICSRRMYVRRQQLGEGTHHRKPDYACMQRTGSESEVHNHFTSYSLHLLDTLAWEKVIEVVKNPQLIRAKVEELRAENKSSFDEESIKATIASFKQQLDNLFKLAQHATDDSTLETLSGMMKNLEKQKREAEALLYNVAEEEEEREEIEAEIVKFEQWAEKVRPLLQDASYVPTYEEQRLAVRILGVRATIFPARGEYPFRVNIEVTVPGITEKMKNCAIHHR
jgi:site-specific DNA recombinase